MSNQHDLNPANAPGTLATNLMVEWNINGLENLTNMLHCSPWQDEFALLSKANQEARQILLANQLNETTMLVKDELVVAIAAFLNQVGPLVSELEGILEGLKETFLELLHFKLSLAQVNLESRLVLGLNVHWELQLVDKNHSDAAKIEQILLDSPELGIGLREIARQSLFLRGVLDVQSSLYTPEHDIINSKDLLQRQLLLNNHGLDYQTELNLNNGAGAMYHVCLSGALSHFYFPQMR